MELTRDDIKLICEGLDDAAQLNENCFYPEKAAEMRSLKECFEGYLDESICEKFDLTVASLQV
ncbi:MAG: hypothetical protein ACFB0C_06160 [Leptolyngbyaceae cyanobacterium]